MYVHSEGNEGMMMLKRKDCSRVSNVESESSLTSFAVNSQVMSQVTVCATSARFESKSIVQVSGIGIIICKGIKGCCNQPQIFFPASFKWFSESASPS